MSGISMEYVGFTSTEEAREYAFHVRFSPDDSRDYVVAIALAAFNSRRVRYQDGPNICSSRLKRELTANPGVPTGSSFLIEESELDDQKLIDSPDTPHRRHGPKLPNG